MSHNSLHEPDTIPSRDIGAKQRFGMQNYIPLGSLVSELFTRFFFFAGSLTLCVCVSCGSVFEVPSDSETVSWPIKPPGISMHLTRV